MKTIGERVTKTQDMVLRTTLEGSLIRILRLEQFLQWTPQMV